MALCCFCCLLPLTLAYSLREFQNVPDYQQHQKWDKRDTVVTDYYGFPRPVAEPPFRGKRDAKRTQVVYPSAAGQESIPLTVAREPPLKRFYDDYIIRRLYNVYDNNNDW
ncbi:unnamed protein product [Caenorhabditis angaria]|uniref:Uncharacterized protein n=1 Tax=Caenorhabditis angaria TaxID=860376 RepID=A0A9P1N180_9PELO|nr:unnamed protein product [Caenorhabditis angaria]